MPRGDFLAAHLLFALVFHTKSLHQGYGCLVVQPTIAGHSIDRRLPATPIDNCRHGSFRDPFLRQEGATTTVKSA